MEEEVKKKLKNCWIYEDDWQYITKRLRYGRRLADGVAIMIKWHREAQNEKETPARTATRGGGGPKSIKSNRRYTK